MVTFTADVLKFGKNGEKTGWTYITVPAKIAEKIKPGYKKIFRVKGKLDDVPFEMAALLPMGEGEFILPINAGMRKALHKKEGDRLKMSLEEDKRKVPLNPELIACLEDEPGALKFFNSLPGSHKNYYSKWIDSAKTDGTKAKRIAQTVNAMARNLSFQEMMHDLKKQRSIL